MDNFRMPLIGEKAPEFKANTTYGPVNFPADFNGKWVVFFSHPGDFTPVCTTEIMTFASMKDLFAANNTSLLGLSVDSNTSHIAWTRDMAKYSWKNINNPMITFPIIADDFGNVARMYGMLMPSVSSTKTVRTVFIVDGEGMIRAILVYPLTTGRNINEILRLVQALQAYDKTGNPTPADWMPGENQLFSPPQTLPNSQQRLDEQKTGGYECLDWYMCFVKNQNNNMNEPGMPQSFAMPTMGMTQAAPMQTKMNTMNMPVRTNMQENFYMPTIQEYPNTLGMTEKSGMMPSGSNMFMPERQQSNVSAAKQGQSIMDLNRQLTQNSTQSNQPQSTLNEYMITRDYPYKKSV